MITWEPSDRKDRQIQRAKCRQMLRELADEQARIDTIPGYSRNRRRYTVTTRAQRQREIERRGNMILTCITVAAVAWAVAAMVIR